MSLEGKKYADNKGKQTRLKKYGDENYCNKEKVKETLRKTHKIRGKEIKEKTRQTCLEKYNNPTYNNPDKIRNTCLEKYNKPSYSGTEECKEKVKQTCLERFGYEFAFYSPEIKEKIKSSFLKRYGVDHPSKSRIIVNKMLDTKRRNKTFNTSELEEKIYQWLIEIFSIENVIRQYKEERYPFCCDFYIKNLDVFIEVQGHWGHGLHPFDKNNLEDLALLEKWKDKSLESKYYEKVINAWTVRDPLKRETAKKSNLKYLELFDNKITKDELNALILSLKNT